MGINKKIYIYYKLIFQDKWVLHFKITSAFFSLNKHHDWFKKAFNTSINLLDTLVTELIVLKTNKYTLKLLRGLNLTHLIVLL